MSRRAEHRVSGREEDGASAGGSSAGHGGIHHFLAGALTRSVRQSLLHTSTKKRKGTEGVGAVSDDLLLGSCVMEVEMVGESKRLSVCSLLDLKTGLVS